MIYVGKARNLRQRLSNYFQNPCNMHPRTAQALSWLPDTVAVNLWQRLHEPDRSVAR